MLLNGLNNFDLDLTYGNGVFYKNIPEPTFKIDIDPQKEGVIKASSTATGFADSGLNSIMFDPPFLTYIKNGRESDSIMGKRFSGYWRYDELQQHYVDTIKESYRILKKGGIFVIKCQDIIHNHKMHSTHVNVVNWAEGMFRLKDMFILVKDNRIPINGKKGDKKRIQKHARIHHCYFMVFIKL